MRFSGKASASAVLGKVLSARPDLKSSVKAVSRVVQEVVEEVNSLPGERQVELLNAFGPVAEAERRMEEREPPPLPSVERFERVRLRFAPNPDGPLTLGNARAAVLNHYYAERYGGVFILRFEDTSPSVKPPIPEAYDWVLEDLEWLGIVPGEVYYQSERLETYYGYAEVLIEKGLAYVCTCPRESFHRLVGRGEPCPHRSAEPLPNIEMWRRMLRGEFGQGEAVVRVKTELDHPNPAVRDWPALRVDKSPHPRVGRRFYVWPLYNWSCAIDDHEMRVSHVIRGKEHLTNELRQSYVFNYLGWVQPVGIHYGRIKLGGMALSKSKARLDIENGVYRGWDDPRLGTLRALRRRGILPEAVRAVILSMGVKPIEATVDWKNLYSVNRSLLDPGANRYFFAENPVTLRVTGQRRDYTPTPRLHPDHPERGVRRLRLSRVGDAAEVFVSSNDLELLSKSEVVRLIELFNIHPLRVSRGLVEAAYLSDGHDEAVKASAPLIQWVPVEGPVAVRVVMPDASEAVGVGEEALAGIAAGSVVQFVRFGFVRIGEAGPRGVTGYYAHG